MYSLREKNGESVHFESDTRWINTAAPNSHVLLPVYMVKPTFKQNLLAMMQLKSDYDFHKILESI